MGSARFLCEPIGSIDFLKTGDRGVDVVIEQMYEWKNRIQERLQMGEDVSDHQLRHWIEDEVLTSTRGEDLTFEERKEAIQSIFHAIRGLDQLQPLLNDPEVTEIMINGYRDIFIERMGELERSDISFESQEKLEDIIQKVVGEVNRTVNESTPIVDARLKDGSRVHVVLPPVALNGPVMTIRKFPPRPLQLHHLVEKESLSQEAADFLKSLVQAKYNMFISGGTSSGKTTLLNALSHCIPEQERIVTIEDSAELQISPSRNHVRLETRNENLEGKGEIAIRDLIRASLRMRPDRIIVGEVRGSESFDMLQAMNTGHDGSFTTGHGNSTADMLQRLETMVLGAVPLPVEVIRSQICSAIDIIIHLSRLRDGSRQVMQIAELDKVSEGSISLNMLYSFEEGQLVRTGHSLKRRNKWELHGN